MKKIVIGHDRSKQGEDALALGREMAELLGATPVVASVLTWPPNLLGPEDLEIAAELETAELFAAARERLEGLGPETRRRVNRSPAEALYELAGEEKAALIVIGASHRSPIGQVVPGGVGVSLLHGAPCPVLVAPRGFAETEERRFERIAVGFDGSPEAWIALETALRLAERRQAALTVIAVAELPRYRVAASLSVLTAEEYQSYEQEEKRRLLDLALERCRDGVTVDGELLVGEAGAAIAEAAQDFDMVVLGSRGYGPLHRVLLGSASARVIRSAPCPILILPRSSKPDPLGLGRAAGRHPAGQSTPSGP